MDSSVGCDLSLLCGYSFFLERWVYGKKKTRLLSGFLYYKLILLIVSGS